MDMQDIEKKMEMEIDEERAEFAKKFLKRKRLELESLIKQQEHLDCKIADAEEEYDEILGMSVEDVYDKYKANFGYTCTLYVDGEEITSLASFYTYRNN